MTTPVISRELLSSVRDQLLSVNQSMRPPSPELMSPVTSPTKPSLDASVSTDSLLDELLGDIRRSCGASLASTPTAVSSDDVRTDSVFECKLRRSQAELSTLDVSELRSIANTLSQEVDTVSALLVKLLRTKDRHTNRMNKQHHRLTLILQDFAKQNGLSDNLVFSLSPATDREQWLNAWKVLSRLPKGIPKFWRKSLWSELATAGTGHLDWDSVGALAFSEYTLPGDEALGSQIVKDLHRTGNTGFTTEQEHAVLKRVLLAYARYNSSTGYCQGFNVLAALILKVMHFDELLTLKVMVYLIDHILPDNYFAQNLYALSADMAVFRDYLKHFLPELSSHLEGLQKEASGVVKKAYSSDNPPDLQSIHAYEPPLADVFTMQWFLTLFATSLPRKAVRRVWDLVFLEGSGVLIYTAVAILAVMERELLQTDTAADFYTVMAQFGERLRKAQLLPSSEFMQIVFAIQDSANSADTTIPPIAKLREKYTFNICPWVEDEDTQDHDLKKQCPPPSCGGSLSLGGHKDKPAVTKESSPSPQVAAMMSSYQQAPHRGPAMTEQMKALKEHYSTMARQPQKICCNMSLRPPQARIVCPQTKKAVISPSSQGQCYAADVPDSVVEKAKHLSGYNNVQELHAFRKKVFTISYCADQAVEAMEVGSDQLWSTHHKRKTLTREEDYVIRYTQQLS